MATTSIHSIKSTEINAIKYISNPSKTKNGEYVSGSDFESGVNAYEVECYFEAARLKNRSYPEISSKHIIQSFKGDEVTPEQAHELGIELCDRLLKGQYQYVIATHTDTANVHNHIIVNNTNLINGKTFTYLEDRKANPTWKKIRDISDEICKEHGLSVVKDTSKIKGKSWYEWDMANKNLSWKKKLRNAIDISVRYSLDFDDFLKRCEKNGIEVVYKPQNVIDIKFRLKGMQKYVRGKTLGWYYETPQIKNAIKLCKEILDGDITIQRKNTLIDISQEKFAENFGLHNWAVIKNMQEVSKAINILTEMKITNSEDLYTEINETRAKQILLKSELNDKYSKAKDLDELKTAEEEYDFYKVYVNEMNSKLTNRGKKKYADQHETELDRYKFAIKKIRHYVPKGKFPPKSKIKSQIEECYENIRTKNSELKEVNGRLSELEFCRKTIDSILAKQNREDERQEEVKREAIHKRQKEQELE